MPVAPVIGPFHLPVQLLPQGLAPGVPLVLVPGQPVGPVVGKAAGYLFVHGSTSFCVTFVYYNMIPGPAQSGVSPSYLFSLRSQEKKGCISPQGVL